MKLVRTSLLLLLLIHAPAHSQFGTPATTPTTIPIDQAGDFVYVVSPGAGEVAVVGREPMELVGTIHVPGTPRRLTSSRDGRWVAVVSTDVHVVSVIDTRTMGEPFVLRTDQAPMACAFAAGGNELWISHSPGTIHLYRRAEVSGWTEVGTVDGTETADDLLVSREGNTCFAATRAGVQLIDVPSRRVRATGRTKRGGEHLLLSPDERVLYVTNTFIDTVYAVDTRDGATLADMEFDGTVRDVAVAPDGKRLYVSTIRDFGRTRAGVPPRNGEGTLEIIDRERHEMIDSVRTGGLPGSIAVDARGTTIFLAHDKDGIQIIDLAHPRVIDRIASSDGPFTVVKWPRQDVVLVTGSSGVALLQTNEQKLGRLVPVGRHASILCFAGMGNANGKAFLTKPTEKAPLRPAAPGK